MKKVAINGKYYQQSYALFEHYIQCASSAADLKRSHVNKLSSQFTKQKWPLAITHPNENISQWINKHFSLETISSSFIL